MHHLLLSTLSADSTLGLLSMNGLAAIIMVWAVARLVRAPREWFSFGRASKVAWVIVSVWFSFGVGGVLVPLGAVAALWHLRRLRRRHDATRPADLPFAAGAPVRSEKEK